MKHYRITTWNRPGYQTIRLAQAGEYRELSRVAKAYVRPGRMVVLWEEDHPICLYYWLPELRMIGAYYVGVRNQ
jgi:hypothetical protein